MARLARVVVPGVPHHVTQRGNRRQATFFGVADYEAYRSLMAESCTASGVEVWAYCLMPNHVHLIVVPASAGALRAAIGEAHRRYTRLVNLREGWRGHLWQGRFASFAMDSQHLHRCVRYVELNPVRARLVDAAEEWPYSSARAHLAGRDDVLARAGPLMRRVGDWRAFLSEPAIDDTASVLRRHEATGRPLGDDGFISRLESQMGRPLRKRKPGPRPADRTRARTTSSKSLAPMR